MDLHTGLESCGGGEDLGVMDGQGGVALHQPGGNAAHSLNGQAQRGHIQQEDPGSGARQLHSATRQDITLHGGALGHTLVRIDVLRRLNSC